MLLNIAYMTKYSNFSLNKKINFNFINKQSFFLSPSKGDQSRDLIYLITRRLMRNTYIYKRSKTRCKRAALQLTAEVGVGRGGGVRVKEESAQSHKSLPSSWAAGCSVPLTLGQWTPGGDVRTMPAAHGPIVAGSPTHTTGLTIRADAGASLRARERCIHVFSKTW